MIRIVSQTQFVAPDNGTRAFPAYRCAGFPSDRTVRCSRASPVVIQARDHAYSSGSAAYDQAMSRRAANHTRLRLWHHHGPGYLTRRGTIMEAQHTRTRAVVAGLVLIAGLTGCSAVEQNPLNVNASRSAVQGGADASGTGRDSADPAEGSAASFITENLDDDPLKIGVDGATLCGVQPKDSFLQYTIMVHNPTLETFTFNAINLGASEGLTQVSATITPANREGHGNHGAPAAGPGDHSSTGHDTPAPTPTASVPSTFSVEPVPAVGYQFEPDQHINIVVSVALQEGVQRGTADDIVVGFSSPGREFSVPHDLNITIDRTTCS